MILNTDIAAGWWLTFVACRQKARISKREVRENVWFLSPSHHPSPTSTQCISFLKESLFNKSTKNGQKKKLQIGSFKPQLLRWPSGLQASIQSFPSKLPAISTIQTLLTQQALETLIAILATWPPCPFPAFMTQLLCCPHKPQIIQLDLAL